MTEDKKHERKVGIAARNDNEIVKLALRGTHVSETNSSDRITDLANRKPKTDTSNSIQSASDSNQS